MLCEMCRSVLFAKRPPPPVSATFDWKMHCTALKFAVCAQRPPPRVFARHRSRRVSTSTASGVSSATPPPTASCDDVVALASAIVTLNKCTMLPLAKTAPPYCEARVDGRGAQRATLYG
eukprot:346099-Prymnesium_polylepis.1